MANKRHLSRLAAPKSWPVKRKGMKWISKPLPGPHTLDKSMPISIYLKEVLGLTKNSAEVKKVLNQGLVLVNGKVVKEPRFPVGLFDILKILKYNKVYRVLLELKGKLILKEISNSEENLRPIRVNGKTTIKGGKTQVNFSNGWNLVVDKDVYKVNDVIIFDTKEKKPVKHLKLEKGNLVYITGGTHSGKVGRIKDIVKEGILRKKAFVVASYNEERIKVPIKEAFVIGEEEQELAVQ